MAKLTREEVIARIREGKSLAGEDLSELKLGRAKLSGADLGRADLIGADLPGANIWNIATADWKIDGVTCEYVYIAKTLRIRKKEKRLDVISPLVSLNKFTKAFINLTSDSFALLNGRQRTLCPLKSTRINLVVYQDFAMQ